MPDSEFSHTSPYLQPLSPPPLEILFDFPIGKRGVDADKRVTSYEPSGNPSFVLFCTT